MSTKDYKRTQEEFEREHETRARAGWPGSWADIETFSDVFNAWHNESRTEFLAAGNDAWNEYMLETEHRYARYKRDVEENAPNHEAWQAFLDDTRQFRVKFRNLALAKYFELQGKESKRP